MFPGQREQFEFLRGAIFEMHSRLVHMVKNLVEIEKFAKSLFKMLQLLQKLVLVNVHCSRNMHHLLIITGKFLDLLNCRAQQ